MSDMDPRSYYDDLAEGEWQRLDATPVSRMEFANTTTYLARHLPDHGCVQSDTSASTAGRPDARSGAPVRVLDAGGGPGRYAVWLAERGYEVIHCDLSAEQVRIARERTMEHGFDRRIRSQQADVRALPFETDAFDAICCLGGPLSHVLDPAERERSMAELGRVARDDAPVFVSVIGRLSALRGGIKFVLPSESGERHGFLDRIAEEGAYTQELADEHADGEGWAECHFFRADELEADLEAAGFDVETLVGLEGPASNLGGELADASPKAREEVAEVVETLREDRAVVDFSEHILAVCRS